MSFSGKVVLITGASSGIGADAAIEFAKKGAKVALVGRNEDRLNVVIDVIKKNSSSEPLAIIADVSKDATRIIDQTIKRFNRLDILVNNAGFGVVDNASNIDLEKFDSIFGTNVRGIVELTKLAVPLLEQTKGNVVNISSNFGLKPYKDMISYCMSKAALDMYTKCASLELAPKGIRVNSINPGMTKTSFMIPLGMNADMENELIKQHLSITPARRIGIVSDTTNAILFVTDEKSSFINGALLVVDGGKVLA